DNFSWPFIFFINVPIVLICSPFAKQMLKRFEQAAQRAPIDVIGLVLLVVFVSTLQIMLDLGKDEDWFASTEVCVLAGIALVGFAAFLIWELTEAHPIVDLRVFRHRGFVAAIVTLSLGYGSMFGANVLTPLWLQSYMGYTSTWAGMTTAWSGVCAVLMAPVTGVLMTKIRDPRLIAFVGLVWIALIMYLRPALTSDVTYWQIAQPLLFMGIGLPLFFVPLTALSLGSVEEHETASAAGLQNFLRTMSGAVATSLVTTLWEDKTTYIHAELAGLPDRGRDLLNSMIAAGTPLAAALAQLHALVEGQSVMI